MAILRPAHQTDFPMHAQQLSALFTLPLLFFLLNEGSHSNLADCLQVLNNIFSIFCSIPLIQVLNSLAKKLGAFDAKCFIIAVFFRAFFYPASFTIVRLIALIVTPDASVFIALESQAYITDYPTWGNAFGIHNRLFSLSFLCQWEPLPDGRATVIL